ncbi:MAG: hypothetical protein JW993_08260 [Sedimentisphaerales bacterium]|nr:hypothetical protein [Sedimentisphaerales bacterium]
MPARRGNKALLLTIPVCLFVAVASFVVLALLPRSEGPALEDPLRSFLTGLGVLGVAVPLCLAGARLHGRFASSPYYEGTFIATVLSVFGFVCAAAGMACLIIGIYDIAVRLFGS